MNRAAAGDYVCPMTAIETPQPVTLGPQAWPLGATSHEYDRSTLRAYAGAGVKECWLVLGPEKQIAVLCQPQSGQLGQHAVHGLGGRLTSAAVPSFTVELDHLFVARKSLKSQNPFMKIASFQLNDYDRKRQ